jgi:hypothetical protein
LPEKSLLLDVLSKREIRLKMRLCVSWVFAGREKILACVSGLLAAPILFELPFSREQSPCGLHPIFHPHHFVY